jgi:hypothetical protein
VLGLSQNAPGRKVIGIMRLYQFGNSITDEDGSKLENRLVIIIMKVGSF